MIRKVPIGAVVALLALALAVGAPSAAPQGESQTRSVSGQVLDKQDAPLANAVVHLKNTKTLALKTFITDESGDYRFSGLSPNVDYELHAELKGHRSDTKTISSFDSKKQLVIHLKIDTSK
ncbi:MAG: carboxypeptidase-like regulatory domain-containing protein [Terriglobales bacterium]